MIIILIRSCILYIVVIFSLRLMGKKQIGELQPSELVVTILISNLATLFIDDTSTPMLLGAVPMMAIIGLDILLSGATLKSNFIRTVVSGKPMIIISDGNIDQSALRRLRFTIDDMIGALRDKDVFDIRDVQFAIVETTGQVNVLTKDNANTENPPTIIISDGSVLDTALQGCNLSEQWLAKILKKEKLSHKNVFLMTADQNANYYIVKKEGI